MIHSMIDFLVDLRGPADLAALGALWLAVNYWATTLATAARKRARHTK